MIDGQTLTSPQLVQVTGATIHNLHVDPLLKDLPLELTRVLAFYPRQTHLNESKLEHLRRLVAANRNGELESMVDGQPLRDSQLARLTGVNASNVRQDPIFAVLSTDLQAVRDGFRRLPGELQRPYARRLHAASQAGVASAMVNGSSLTMDETAAVVGCRITDLRTDPYFKPLPGELVPIRDSFTRLPGEDDLAFAKRLHTASKRGDRGTRVDGHALSLSQVSALSGEAEKLLRQDPFFIEVPPELEPVYSAHPRNDDELPLDYAKRLHRASQQDLPDARVDGKPLTYKQLSKLSGASVVSMRTDREFRPFPEELEPIQAAHGAVPGQSKIDHARQLYKASLDDLPDSRVNGQVLTIEQVMRLTGAKRSALTKDARFQQLLERASSAAPVTPAIKVEAPAPKPMEIFEEQLIDQSRTGFHRVLSQHCDLTAEEARWTSTLAKNAAYIVNHPMDPIPEMEAAFPLRDPRDPLHRVHPRYADATGQLSSNVRLVGKPAMAVGVRSMLQSMSRDTTDARVPKMDRARMSRLCDDLEVDVQAEMKRLIEGRMPDPPRTHARKLTKAELPAHEKEALGNRYGLFVPELPENQRPTLLNGRVLGVYLGALNEADDELDDYRASHPGSVSYEMEIVKPSGGKVTVSALGATNHMALANTALDPDSPTPAYDLPRINAIFIPFNLRLTDKDGHEHPRTVMTMVGLDNLYASSNPRREIRVDYEDAYLDQFQQPSTPQADVPDMESKIEPA